MSSKKAAREEDDLGIDLGALNATFLGSLGDALASASGSGGTMFRLVRLALLDEDPGNPRRHFDAAGLAELAEVIRERGFNSAVRVRKNPDKPGHFLICEGHRRCRAAALAGLQEVPALISDNFERLDQILENLKREPLTDFEMAAFIRAQLEQGVKKIDLARRMRVSPAYITQHLALFAMSEALAAAYARGVIRDLTGVATLVNLEKGHPAEVAAFLGGYGEGEITRNDIARLKNALAGGELGEGDAGREPGRAPPKRAGGVNRGGAPDFPPDVEREQPAVPKKAGPRPLGVFVKTRDGEEAGIVTERAARSPKHAWIRLCETGDEREVALKGLEIFEVRRV